MNGPTEKSETSVNVGFVSYPVVPPEEECQLRRNLLTKLASSIITSAGTNRRLKKTKHNSKHDWQPDR